MATHFGASLGRIISWTVILATPFAIHLFASRAWGGGFLHNLRRFIVDYRWHLFLLVLVLIEKNWVDALNDPIRGVFGDFTWLVHAIEGDATYALQRTFLHPWLTSLLNVHYLWMYVFLNYFTILLLAYRDDREAANMVSLNYAVIYLLAVPFYIFFNVQITSDFIPGMQSLLYHGSPGFFDFFIAADPLDNAFPSLHIAIPFGMILVLWWTMRRRGYTLRDWEHRRYLWFMLVNFAVFVFSILYLGIHWIIDIPGGLLVGLIGATIADEFRFDMFRLFEAAERRLVGWLRPVVDAARSRLGRA